MCSDGEPVQVLSRKGKEDCPELLTVLAVILKENYLLDPCVVSGNPLWEARSPLGKICPGVNGSPGRETPLRGSTRKLVRSTQKEPPTPSTGLGRWRQMLQRTQLWKEKEKKNKKKKKIKWKTKSRTEKGKTLSKKGIPFWNTGSTGIKLLLMNASRRPYLHSFVFPRELGLGLGLTLTPTLIPLRPVAMVTYCLLAL